MTKEGLKDFTDELVDVIAKSALGMTAFPEEYVFPSFTATVPGAVSSLNMLGFWRPSSNAAVVAACKRGKVFGVPRSAC